MINAYQVLRIGYFFRPTADIDTTFVLFDEMIAYFSTVYIENSSSGVKQLVLMIEPCGICAFVVRKCRAKETSLLIDADARHPAWKIK